MGPMNDAADQGIEHLQAAAREMVSAARSFLDAVDEIIDDRDRLGSIANGLADLVERAGSVFTSTSPTSEDTGTDGPTRPRRADRVQRIHVE